MHAIAHDLPSFTKKDMEEWMDIDPVYGPQLRKIQNGGNPASKDERLRMKRRFALKRKFWVE